MHNGIIADKSKSFIAKLENYLRSYLNTIPTDKWGIFLCFGECLAVAHFGHGCKFLLELFQIFRRFVKVDCKPYKPRQYIKGHTAYQVG